jgi:hypothetical protein
MKALIGVIGLSLLADGALAAPPKVQPPLPSPPRNCGEAGLLPMQIPSCGEFYTTEHGLVRMPSIYDRRDIAELGQYPDGLLEEIGPDTLLGAIFRRRQALDN